MGQGIDALLEAARELAHPLLESLALDAEHFVEDAAHEALARERAHCGERVGHLAHRDGPERDELHHRGFDRLGVELRPDGDARPDETLHPRNEARAAGHLTPHRAELEVRVRVDEARQHGASHPLHDDPRVARQDVPRRSHVDDLPAPAKDHGTVADVLRVPRDHRVRVYGTHSGLCS